MNFFESDDLSALESIEKAQWIAFAPVVFQTTRVLRDTGILQCVESNKDGLTLAQIIDFVKLSEYGVRVLTEAALGIGLLTEKDGIYKITKTATFILHDRLTQVNLDFIHDVCYNGLFFLEESIRNKKPEGLKVFGRWPTIYEALSKLPSKVQESWFGFDHYYSDVSFSQVLPLVFKSKPKRLLDIGGNTGKWAIKCFEYDPEVTVTILDLPGQVGMAREQIAAKGFADRIRFHECNILDEKESFPTGFDAIWMSQFLDCFSDSEIKSILRRCRKALSQGGKVYILEPFWDRQRFKAAAFSLQQTSLYFTAMANGNSQMYHSDNFIRYVHEAGFSVVDQKDGIGVSHTLLTCEPK
jgi:ubiquinone/menaquinone biosynthesis C-methylase UbiE